MMLKIIKYLISFLFKFGGSLKQLENYISNNNSWIKRIKFLSYLGFIFDLLPIIKYLKYLISIMGYLFKLLILDYNFDFNLGVLLQFSLLGLLELDLDNFYSYFKNLIKTLINNFKNYILELIEDNNKNDTSDIQNQNNNPSVTTNTDSTKPEGDSVKNWSWNKFIFYSFILFLISIFGYGLWSYFFNTSDLIDGGDDVKEFNDKSSFASTISPEKMDKDDISDSINNYWRKPTAFEDLRDINCLLHLQDKSLSILILLNLVIKPLQQVQIV